VIESLDLLKTRLGKEFGVTPWLEMTQERINQFAETTEDRQWIHVDRDRASRESPYGATIAHGFLTLSLLSKFLSELMQMRGAVRMSVNYGLNRVRFTSAVPAGSKIRARFGLAGLKESADFVDATYAVTVEREDADKPCCVAEWIVRYYR
jgi:acyl dehydratase